jgi:hypothetical protein
MSDLNFLKNSLIKVGWFISPYRGVGTLEMIARSIEMQGKQYSQDALEKDLSGVYGPDGLAAMVLHRYPLTPIIRDYSQTISEAIEAHFIGLDHVAVGGLIPVLEGVAVRLAAEREISVKGPRKTLAALAEGCKLISAQKKIGDSAEIASMMDSFSTYATDFMYVDSALYPLVDKTNRHGIAHGHYADDDYGRPLNFYKTIAAVDFLTLVSSFTTNSISGFAPSQTPESKALSRYYSSIKSFREKERPNPPLLLERIEMNSPRKTEKARPQAVKCEFCYHYYIRPCNAANQATCMNVKRLALKPECPAQVSVEDSKVGVVDIQKDLPNWPDTVIDPWLIEFANDPGMGWPPPQPYGDHRSDETRIGMGLIETSVTTTRRAEKLRQLGKSIINRLEK